MDLDFETTIPPSTRKSLLASFSRRIVTVALILAILWSVYLIDAFVLRGSLSQHGIVPRTLRGLLGIFCAPFLLASLSHLISNTIGILMLGSILIIRSEPAFWATTFLGVFVGGLGTWIIGRSQSDHIGASGVIFAWFGYLLFAGIFESRIGSILLSVAVFMLWGGMLWSTIPFCGPGAISWESHLCGLASGVLAAKLISPRQRSPLGESPQINSLGRGEA
jgi:membrane associated rhomboid family serine protease